MASETSLDEEAVGTVGRDHCRFRACALGLSKDQPPLVRTSLLLLLVVAWTRGAGSHGLLYGSHRDLKCAVRLSDVSVDMDETSARTQCTRGEAGRVTSTAHRHGWSASLILFLPSGLSALPSGVCLEDGRNLRSPDEDDSSTRRER